MSFAKVAFVQSPVTESPRLRPAPPRLWRYASTTSFGAGPGSLLAKSRLSRYSSLKKIPDVNTGQRAQAATSAKTWKKSCPSQQWGVKEGPVTIRVPRKKIYLSYKSCGILKGGFLFFLNSSYIYCVFHTDFGLADKVLKCSSDSGWSNKKATSGLWCKISVLLMPPKCCCCHQWGTGFTFDSTHTQFLTAIKCNVTEAWSYLKT